MLTTNRNEEEEEEEEEEGEEEEEEEFYGLVIREVNTVGDGTRLATGGIER